MAAGRAQANMGGGAGMSAARKAGGKVGSKKKANKGGAPHNRLY